MYHENDDDKLNQSTLGQFSLADIYQGKYWANFSPALRSGWYGSVWGGAVKKLGMLPMLPQL